jgi:aminoglycoside phosphotransferase (APT) family kinase protein
LQSPIREHWPEPEVGHPPDTFSWLLLTTGARTISKVVGLVFADGQDAPGMVVKMPRVPEAVPALKREAETLDAIHASHPRPVAGVPRVLFYKRNAGTVALAETVVTGVPLWVKLRRTTYRMLALRVTHWLAEFAGRTEHVPRSAWGDRLVDTTMRTFTSQFAPVLDPEKIRKTEEALDQLDALPMVCEQRDFGPWNVLVAPDGALGVLDWESAELRGLPALDLIYFLSFQAFFHDRTMRSRQFRPSYRTLLDASTFTGSIHAECMARYTERVGIEPRLLHPLRLLCWMIHAGSDYRHLAADVAGDPCADDLRRSAFLGLWEEELAHR